MILCVGTSSESATYFHVAGQGLNEAYGVYAYPKFMIGDVNFDRYLIENGKKEIRRLDAKITNPSGAYQKLMLFMAEKWFWKVLPSNCATFAREIIRAGGGDLTVLLNCPDQEVVKGIGRTVNEVLEREVEFLRQNRGPKW